ncbi:MAG: metallophosphoesterase [Clostridia bacterium]|nr:metallophosphoesterase [Clostridia bacterium]
MKLSAEKEKYFSDGYEVFWGDPSHPQTCIYRVRGSGVHFHEHIIDSGKGGEAVEIAQITDVHFNYCDDTDRADPELAYTEQCRKWLAGGASVAGIEKAMEFASFADQTIITGDTLDYLSHGSLEMMKKYIWDKDETVLCALGGHELTKQMQTGRADETSLEERMAILQDYWRHDMFYVSRVLGDKAMVIVLDNSKQKYTAYQTDKLKSDIALAREKNYVVLVFQHEPISTGREEDTQVEAYKVYDSSVRNYYDLIGVKGDDETKALYKVITENADVIRGVYCGHMHSAFYTEIKGSYLNENGEIVEKSIPQYLLEANPYDGQCGHVMKITVK